MNMEKCSKVKLESKSAGTKKMTKASEDLRKKVNVETGKLCSFMNDDVSVPPSDKKCILKIKKDTNESSDADCAVQSDCKIKSKKKKISMERNLRITPSIKKKKDSQKEESSILKSKSTRKKISKKKEIEIPEGISPVKRRRLGEISLRNSSSCEDKRPLRKSQGKIRTRASRLSSDSNKDIVCKKVKGLRTVGRKSSVEKQAAMVNKTSGQKRRTTQKSQSQKKLDKDGQCSTTRKTAEDQVSVDLDNAKSSKEVDTKKYVGAHLSIAGGLYKCIEEAVKIGAKACGLFLKSQRQWAAKPISEETILKFKETIETHNYPIDMILPHGSYLLNCGSPDSELWEKSLNALVEELQRCERLGIKLYNFHPGSTCGKISVEKCLDNIAECINKAHTKTNSVITVVENMCCQGNTVGGRLEELRGIIERVKDKSRVGVCIDTCHAFAAGFDISNKKEFDKFVTSFEEIVGFEYLKALHLNDSKGQLGCHLDRHENIGKGNIGLKGFRNVMNEPKFNNIPMILETPAGLEDEEEIDILYSLCR